MNRAEHLEWCKQRARDYLAERDIDNAIASMLSDLNKHPETALKEGGSLAPLGLLYCLNKDLEGARRFIEGFN